jgi:hypothetical protein
VSAADRVRSTWARIRRRDPAIERALLDIEAAVGLVRQIGNLPEGSVLVVQRGAPVALVDEAGLPATLADVVRWGTPA